MALEGNFAVKSGVLGLVGGIIEVFLKKVSEKFGWFKKSAYLCTRKSESGGSVAQLNRASDYGSEGCGFESRLNHKEDNRKRLQSQQLAIFLS